ncbi:rhodanese-like domain-containing protein [Kytococcus sp. Marseille-QA3725]
MTTQNTTTQNTAPASRENSAPSEIAVAELRRSLSGAQKPFLLDVRTDGEFGAGHVPGAVLLPLHRIQEDPQSVARELGACGELVVICQSGNRATTAAQELAPHLSAGTSPQVLAGGMNAWEQAGGETREGSGTGVWDMQRQVRFAAGSMVLAAVLASVKAPAVKWAAAGVGTGLAVSGVTGACPMASGLAKMPWNRGTTLEDGLCAVRERHQGR